VGGSHVSLRLAVAVLAALVLAPTASALQGRVVEDSFASKGLQSRLSFAIYLPPGYDAATTRYPVVYYLHGLPADARAFTSFRYVVNALELSHRQAIVVAPQGAHDGDTDAEYLDWSAGREWETAIAVELPRVVDNRYRTLPRRSARAILGVSAGGYGATVIGLHHLDEFGAIESWSGYFHPTDPSGTHVLQREPEATPLNLVTTLRGTLSHDSTFLGFYVGASDTRFRPDNVLFARALSRASVPFTFRMYPGGHQQSLWSAQAPVWLGLALDRLDAAQ
jgi:enterochelin esterase-like enzyme